jgi:hypothetical protein
LLSVGASGSFARVGGPDSDRVSRVDITVPF